jgi:hypothetical protein
MLEYALQRERRELEVSRPYAGSGSIVHTPPTIRASRAWGKRHYNLTGATCSPVTVTDRLGNTRTIAPLVHGQVVRLHKRTYKVVKQGERVLTPDLTEAQERAILEQLKANATPRAQGFNIHDK